MNTGATGIDFILIYNRIEHEPLVSFPDVTYSKNGRIFLEDNSLHFPYNVAFTDEDGSTQLYQWSDPLADITRLPGESTQVTIRTVTGNDIFIYYGNDDVKTLHLYADDPTDVFDEWDTFDYVDTAALDVVWTDSGGTWTAPQDVPMPVLFKGDVGNVGGSSGRLHARFSQIFKKGENDYRMIFVNCLWELHAIGWPLPFSIYIASGTSPDGEFGAGHRLKIINEIGDDIHGGYIAGQIGFDGSTYAMPYTWWDSANSRWAM
ncbi:unnamed protein product, partial [marine sediment metagenome]